MNQVIDEKHRPVQHLQALYTVVVGIALTVSLTELIDVKAEVPFRLSVLPYFLAYFVTLVPFYHGALRHLDVTYVHNAASRPRSGALMADWGLLFCESCLLLAIALLVARPRPFSYALISLLLFDTVWAFVAHLAFSPPGQLAELRWAKMNLVTSGMLILTMVYLHSLDASTKPIDTYMWIVVLTVCVLRTIVDYSWCWSFYYPGGTNEEAS